MELRRIFKTGNSRVVALPADVLRYHQLAEGSIVQVFNEVDCIRLMPVVKDRIKMPGAEVVYNEDELPVDKT